VHPNRKPVIRNDLLREQLRTRKELNRSPFAQREIGERCGRSGHFKECPVDERTAGKAEIECECREMADRKAA
jgi:hypothetical protein